MPSNLALYPGHFEYYVETGSCLYLLVWLYLDFWCSSSICPLIFIFQSSQIAILYPAQILLVEFSEEQKEMCVTSYGQQNSETDFKIPSSNVDALYYLFLLNVSRICDYNGISLP